MDISGHNINLSRAGLTREQKDWVERNIIEPSLMVSNPRSGRKPDDLREYARGFKEFVTRHPAAMGAVRYYHADATQNHPPTAPPDLIVCHNTFGFFNSAAKLEPLIKALQVGGVLSLGQRESNSLTFRLNPLQRRRYGLKPLAPGIFRKTRGPVELLPPVTPLSRGIKAEESRGPDSVKTRSNARGGRRR